MRLFSSPRRTQRVQVSRRALVVSMMLAIFQLPAHAQGQERPVKHPTFYRMIQVDGLSIFYREAGPKDAPTLLLLHGLPSSSDTVTGQTRKNSRTRSITSPKP